MATHSAALPDTRLWGKLGYGAPNPYPVLAHMLDTSAAAFVLWDKWLRPGLRDLLTTALAPGDESEARAMVAAIAGLHDIGKISAIFQLRQLDTRPAKPEQKAYFKTLHRKLRQSGYDVTLPTEKMIPGTKLLIKDGQMASVLKRHEALSLHVIAEQWPAGDDFVAESWVAAVIGGHHGRFHPYEPALFDGDEEIEEQRAQPASTVSHIAALTHGKWGEQQQAHIDFILRVCGTNRLALERPLEDASTAVVLISGLVTLADWLASSGSSVESGVTSGFNLLREPDDWFRDRHDFFVDLVPKTIGVYDGPLNPRKEILQKHADTPSELQQAASHAGGGLWIATVPTGDGKTEFAVLRHANRTNEALQFALPTRGTTDAIFERIAKFYQKTRSAGALAHSYASINPYYRLQTDEEDTKKRGLRPLDWLFGNSRGNLAPVTVSTCDQVLLAALKQNRSYLRLLATANRHIVLDEVHTYDRYQERLLAELLTWWGATNTRVTMLSASLPTGLLNRYIAAYTGKPSDVPAIYPGWTHASPGSVTEQRPVQSRREYDLHFNVIETPDMTVVQTLAAKVDAYRAISQHTHIAVVVNTVDRCIAVAQQIRQAGHTVLVLHSRMTAAHRKSVSDRIDALREARTGFLEGVVVVGTQTIESSLDVDFDHMISDLAPTPALIQRAGRLWRHSKLVDGKWDHSVCDRVTGEFLYTRKRHAEHPVLDIVVMRDSKVPALLSELTRFPYLMAEQRRTLAAVLDTGGSVHIPTGVQALVDASVPEELSDGKQNIPRDLDSGVTVSELMVEETSALARLARADQVVINMRGHRQGAPLLDPDLTYRTLSASTTLNDEVEAATRFMEWDTQEYLILDPTGQTEWAWHGGVEKASRVRPDTDQAVELVGCTLSLRKKQAAGMVVNAVEMEDWKPVTPALRFVQPVTIAPGARYDTTLGLLVSSKA